MSASQDPPEYTPPGSTRGTDPAAGDSGPTSIESGEAGGSAAPAGRRSGSRSGRREKKAPNMLPGRERRRFGPERVLVRLIATGGILGIGVVIAAIMVSSKSQGWVIGLVVSGVSVILSAILWSSRSV